MLVKGLGGDAIVSKGVQIKNIKGRLVFWISHQSFSIDVSVSNQLIGTINKIYSSTPSCGDDGCVTIRGTEGTYNFTAKENKLIGPASWSGQFTIVSGECRTTRLTQ